ncbi:MBG domain-containing protein [Roseivirga misakiensis]|uniref:Cadherin domain-containing protein n=1 Tax=Roseivirga misakiensis TaxID=1563681 RepID=A0A1E5T4A0_9BACT|nr:MBG domain-containing protein [Roseivirga misakiensis]OEK06208.1 hypothetical protein BFP71_00590 [Roseivirga misakiensis]
MKRILLNLIGLFVSLNVIAQTNVSGNINANTTWTKANSPYILQGDVGIGTGQKLTIEPGVTVKRSGNYYILVKGAIYAVGTEQDSIKFEDSYPSQASETKFFLSFQETNLSNTTLSFLNVKSLAESYNTRTLFARVSKESEGNQAGVKSSGVLTISNSSFLGNYLATDGYQANGKLLLDNVKLFSSTVYGNLRGEPIEIKNSYGKSSVIYSGSYNDGITIDGSKFEQSEFVIGCCGANLSFNKADLIDSKLIEGSGNPKNGPVSIDDSKFINTSIYLPSAYVETTKSIFFSNNRNLRTGEYGNSSSAGIGALIFVGRLNMSDCYVRTPQSYGVLITGRDGYNVAGLNSISNSHFENNYDAISITDHAGTNISNNSFFNTLYSAISNTSSKDVNARSNYFDGLNSLEEIENTIWHYDDFISYGKVDFSNFLIAPPSIDLLLPPKVRLERKFSGDDYTSEVRLSFSNLDNSTTSLRVLKYDLNDILDTTFVTNVALPFNDIDLPLLMSGEYSVVAKGSGDSESWFGTTSNERPVYYPIIDRISINEDETGKLSFKLFNAENDLIKIKASSPAAESLINDENIVVEKTKTDGDTTFYDVTVFPEENAFGVFDVELRIEDGLNINEGGLGRVTVNAVNDFKPVLSDVNLITGLSEDRTFYFSNDNFWSKIQATDQDGDEVKYLITEIVSGDLSGNFETNNAPAKVGDTLVVNQSYNWTPAADAFGEIDGFKIRATDGELNSDTELTVSFEVQGINDCPSATSQSDYIFSTNDEFKFQLTQLSAGPNESQELTITPISTGNLGSTMGDFIDLDDFDFSIDQTSQVIDVTFNTGSVKAGKKWFSFRLSDGQCNVTINLNIEVYEPFLPPTIQSTPTLNAYSGIEYQYSPTLPSDDAYQLEVIKSPSFLNGDSTWVVGNLIGVGGIGDEPGSRRSARLSQPTDIVFDSEGIAYISDRGSNKIYKLSKEGVLTRFSGNGYGFADGGPQDAKFRSLEGIALGPDGDLYVVDFGSSRLAKVSSSGEVSSIIASAGNDNGPVESASLSSPIDIQIDSEGNVFVLQANPKAIRMISKEGVVSNYVDGNTPGFDISQPVHFAINSNDQLILSDKGSNNVYLVEDGSVQKLILEDPSFRSQSVDFLNDTTAFISNESDSKIYLLDLKQSVLKPFAGLNNRPFKHGIDAIDYLPNLHYKLVYANDKLYSTDMGGGTVKTFFETVKALRGIADVNDEGKVFEVEIKATDLYGSNTTQSFDLTVKASDKVEATNLTQLISYVEDELVELTDIIISGLTDEDVVEASLMLSTPEHGILTSDSGNGEVYNQSTGRWFISGTMEKVNSALTAVSFQPTDNLDVNSEILSRVILSGGAIPNEGIIKLEVTPINDAPSLINDPKEKTFTEFEYSFDVQVDDVDNIAYRMDLSTKPDWLAYNLSENSSSVFVGKPEVYDYVDGNSDEARIRNGYDVEIDSKSNLYFLDGNAVRKVDESGTVTTIAGGSGKDDFILAYSLDIDIHDNLYITDIGRRRLTKITREGQLEVILDKTFGDFADGDLETSRFRRLQDVAVDKDGNIFIADSDNYCIRKIDKDGNVTTPIGSRNNPATPIGSFSDIRIDNMVDIEFDAEGNLLIATLSKVYKANFQTMKVELFAGSSFRRIEDGDKEAGSFAEIRSLETDGFGNVYIGEPTALRRIDGNGQLTTLAGNTSTGFAQGTGADNRFKYIEGIVTLSNGDLIVLDQSNNVLRKIDLRRDYFSGVPTASDIGQSNLEFSLTDGNLTSNYSFSIEVQSNGMPVFDGLNNTFSGNEDDVKIDINTLIVSEVETDPVELKLILSDAKSGKIQVSENSDASFSETSGVWEITGSQDHLNTVISQLEFYPAQDFNGLVKVSVEGKRSGGQFTRTGSFNIKINPINDQPIFNQGKINAMVDLPISIDLDIMDIDGNPVNLISENLPPWLSLTSSYDFEMSTIADLDPSGGTIASVDGKIEEATTYRINSVTSNQDGEVYFAEDRKIRKIEGDSVVTIIDHDQITDFYAQQIKRLSFRNNDLIFSTPWNILQYSNGEVSLIAGSALGYNGDQDGSGSDARFNTISDFTIDNDGNLIILDLGSRKVKKFNFATNEVTTIAGTGGYGQTDGDALNSAFQSNYGVFVDKNGAIYVTQSGAVRKIVNGQVSTIPITNGPRYSSGAIYIDLFENAISTESSGIRAHNKESELLRTFFSTFPYARVDGKNDEMNWFSITDIYSPEPGKILIADNSGLDIRLLTYNINYKLIGTPPDGAEGNQILNFSVSDGLSTPNIYEVPIEILAPDRPEVIGLPQSFQYIEDDSPFVLNAISITTGDQDELFEVFMAPSTESLGGLTSTVLDLSDSLKSGVYRLTGNATKLNEILTSLSFEPGLNNDQSGQVDFSFKRFNGTLQTNGSIGLTVTSVNDVPEILNLSDTTAFVGDSLSILFNAFDIEDGPDVSLSFSEKPDWLNYNQIKAQDELLAGTPGKSGFKLGKGDEAQFDTPFHMAHDTSNTFVFVSLNTHSVLRLDKSGEVSLVAGDGRSGFVDGPVASARFDRPSRVVSLKDGSLLVTDLNNEAIRLIKDGQVTTLIGPNSELSLSDIGLGLGLNYAPISMALSNDEKTLILGRYWQIRFITLETLAVESLDISSLTGSVNISMIDVTNNGDLLVSSSSVINRFSSSGTYITRYGSGSYGYNDGPSNQSQFATTAGAVEDPYGNIYVIDRWNYVIRKIDKNDNVSTVLGRSGQGGYQSGINDQIKINTEGNLLWDNGSLIFADNYNHVIRRIELDQEILSGRPKASDLGEAQVKVVVQDAQDAVSTLDFTINVLENDRPSVSGLDTTIFVGERDEFVSIPKVEIQESDTETIELIIESNGSIEYQLGSTQTDLLSFSKEEEAWLLNGKVAELNARLDNLNLYANSFINEKLTFSFRKVGGKLFKIGAIQIFAEPVNDSPILLSQQNYEVTVGETFELNFEATDVDTDVLSFSSEVLPSWLSGDSLRIIQEFSNPIYSAELPDSLVNVLNIAPTDFAINSKGDVFFVDFIKHSIYQLMSDGAFELYAGTGMIGFKDGPKEEAQFSFPRALVIDKMDNFFIGSRGNAGVRKIDTNGIVTTLIASGPISFSNFERVEGPQEIAKPFYVYELAIDSEGNLYTGELFLIGKIDMDKNLSTIAGLYGSFGDVDGQKELVRFNNAQSVIALGVDSLLIWDAQTFKLKRYANDQVKTIAGGQYGFRDGKFDIARFGNVFESKMLSSGKIAFSDQSFYALRLVDLEDGTISTIAGNGYNGDDYGLATESSIGRITSIVELENGDILIGELGKIKRLAYTMPKITGTPQLSDIGEHKFTLRISDGKDGIIEEEIIINVVAPNSAPTVSEITDVEEVYLPESNAELSLFEYFEDAENSDSELIYEVIANLDPTVINPQTISSEDGLLILDVLNAGETELSIKATDEGGLSVSTTFKVVISQADASIKITYDEGIEEDGTGKSVTVTTEPADLLLNITYNGSTELPVEAGTYEVVVSINERNYKGTNTSEFVLLTANNAPTASEIPDILDTYATELTKELSLYEFFKDAEQEDSELTYEVTANSDPTVINPRVINSENGLLILDVLNAGETELSIKATDEKGLSVSTTFKVIIDQAEASINVVYAEGIEEDGTSKSVSVTTEPADLMFDITYNGSTDLPINAGTYEVIVTVNERNYKGVSTSDFVILTANSSPIATEVSDITDTYAPELTIELSVYDYFDDEEQSDDQLTYELVSISDEMIISSTELGANTGLLKLMVNQAGTATIVLKATDERGLSVTNSFDFVIDKATATISFGTLEFVNDGEDKPVTVTTVPEGLSFDLTYSEQLAVPNTVGSYELKVVIDDPNYEGEATATLNITNVAPSKISVSNRAVYENIGASVTIGELSVTDENGVDTHTFSLVDGEVDNDSFEIIDNELLAKSSFDYELKDTYNIKIMVTDNHGGTYEETFQIDVLDVNESPTIDPVDEVQIVKNLGVLSLNLSGLSAGEDTGQNILISTTSSGVVASSSVVLNSDGRSASLSFETTVDQEGNGIITVIVKDDGGTDNNGVDTKTIEISVLVADPNISVVSGSSCGEGSLSLSASGADNYFWYNSPIGGESFDQGAEITVSLSESTTYYVAGVFGNEESELRVPVNASVFEAVEVPIITNTDNVLSVPQIAGLNYQWFKDGVEIADETSNTYNAEESGSYFVMATNDNGCFANSISLDLIITSLEKELDEVNLIAYPVPASDFITLEFEELFKKGTTIKLIGSSGRVFSTNTLKSSTSSVRIDVRGLPSGTHTVLVRDGGKFARKRIIIKR